MQVNLLSCTPNAEEVCAEAAQICYSDITYEDKVERGECLTPVGIEKMLNKVISSGHLSVIEHATFTFQADGVSRALTHQLVRHRLASFSQQSQRYVNMEEMSYVTPASMDDTDTGILPPGVWSRKDEFNDAMLTCWCAYKVLVDSGVPEEDARYVLPNACTTNIIITMNARELMHFFELRMCNRAQWEIRELANYMYQICMNAAPGIFKYAGPKCWTGKCTEATPCGNPPKKPTEEAAALFGTLFC